MMRRCCSYLLIVVNFVVISCSRPPDLVGIDNPEITVASVETATRHKIFMATTRSATEALGAFYSDRRSPELALTSVDVSIPPNHVLGNLERPNRMPPNPRTEFAIVNPTVYETEKSFVASVNVALQRLPRNERYILLFVHGYNNTTSDSLLRLAQFVEDTNYQGVAVLFSWASAGRATEYVYDMNSALIARPLLADLGRIFGNTNAEGYDIFAHSMGALLAMETARDMARIGQLDRLGRLINIVLASPDIDIDLFRAQMAQIDNKFDKFFVLLSQDDNALGFSRWIAGGVPRLGSADSSELGELGVTTIDLTAIQDSTSGSHSKFAGSPRVVQSIGRGLNSSKDFAGDGTYNLSDFLTYLPIRHVDN